MKEQQGIDFGVPGITPSGSAGVPSPKKATASRPSDPSRKIYRWTGAKLKWMSDNMHLTDMEMAAHLGCNSYRVQAARTRHGLIKSHFGRFQPGSVPHNKGKAAPWANTKCKATQFYKGQRPHTARPPGTIRTEYHKGKPRLMICVEQGRAKPYARFLWAQVNGPVPAGHVVRIANGKWDDVRLDNLICITVGENGRMNREKIDTKARAIRVWATRRLNAARKASEPYKVAT
jgi:hypothetical protein